MVTTEKTEVAVLGTLAEFHKEPIPYDLPALVRLVGEIHPDLLCLDITPEQWQRKAFDNLPPEYEAALLPLAEQTDIVVVPIAGQQPPPQPTASGWRHELANLFYFLTRRLACGETEAAWRRHTDHLTQATLAAARRDPGRLLLVVVNVQHCHHIRRRLRRYPDIAVTTYTEL